MIGLGYDACKVCDHADKINCERCTSTQRNRIMESKRLTGDSIDDSSFLTSVLVGAATDSTLMGWAIGGSLAGAMLGDSMSDNNSSSSDSYSSSSDSSSSCD